MTAHRRPLRIGFLHPDLGLGGSERLVVDAARHLQAIGHHVTMFTTHHDPARCFEETRDGTLDVRVRGDFLPSHVGQRLRAPCMLTRMAYLTGSVALSRDRLDVVFCDLVAHTLPVVKLFSRAKILFYCHFPDRLLVPPAHWLSRLYRVPIDRLEAVGTGLADRLLVNSHYTATVFRRSFPRLEEMPLEVLHPGVDCTRYDGGRAAAHDAEIVVLSINRYERKKNLGLAIEALACLRDRLPPDVFASVRLVIAGDCDDRRREARETLQALQALAVRRGVAERVEFLRSCSEEERLSLLARCRCVVYTPAEEHFGFVPLEAMAAGRPVVAVSSGGPLETIEHGHTGMLCPPTPAAFAEALAGLIGDPAAAERMGRAGRLHVARRFSLAAFGARLQAIVEDVTAPRLTGD